MLNYTYPINSTNFVDIFQWMNYVTNDYFGPAILIMLFSIFFISLKEYPTRRALSAAAALIVIPTILFRLMNLVDMWILLLSITMAMVGIVSLLLDKEVY